MNTQHSLIRLMLVLDERALKIAGESSQNWLYRPVSLRLDKSKTNTHVEFVFNWIVQQTISFQQCGKTPCQRWQKEV